MILLYNQETPNFTATISGDLAEGLAIVARTEIRSVLGGEYKGNLGEYPGNPPGVRISNLPRGTS